MSRGSIAAHEHLAKACIQLLRLWRVPAFRLNQRPVQKRDGSWSSPGADRGAPDILGALGPNGRALCLELKTGAARLSPIQVETMNAWERAGACVAVIRSVDELFDLLLKLGVRGSGPSRRAAP